MTAGLERLVNLIESISPRDTRDMIKAYTLAELFKLVGATQATFTPVDSFGVFLPLSMVFMTIAPQGGGKTRVTSGVGTVFKKAKTAYKAIIDKKVYAYNEELEAKAIAKFSEATDKARKACEAYVKEHSLKGFAQEFTQLGTSQGIAHSIDAMRLLGIGGYCHLIDECADEITSRNQDKQDFISTLLDFSGGKKSVSRPLKGEFFHLNADGIAFNLHFMGNQEGLLESEKTFKQFRTFLRKGFARRTFFTYVQERKIVERHIFDFVPDLSGVEKASVYFERLFLKLINSPIKHFNLDAEATRYLRDCAYEKQFLTGNKDADNERNDHVFKAHKLACILAFIDDTQTVTKIHAESAMAYVEESAKHYLELIKNVEEEALHETNSYEMQIVRLLKQAKEPYRFRDLKEALTPRARHLKPDQWHGVLQEAMEIAEEDGYYLIHEESHNSKGRRGTVCYLTPMIKTTDAIVTYSVKAPDEDAPQGKIKGCTGKGYEKETSTLEQMCLQSSFLHVSPAIFKDGHRKTENVEYLGNLAFFDVDNDTSNPEGMLTVEDAKERLRGYQGVIINSSSYTEARPKFRVVVVLDKEVKGVSGDTYKRILNNIAKHLGIDGAIDKACVEMARYYAQQNCVAGEGITYPNLYGHPLKWEDFIDSTATVARPKVHTQLDVTFTPDEAKQRILKAVNTYCSRVYHDGNRNNSLYRAIAWLRDAGFSESAAEELLRRATSSSPLSEDEFRSTFRSAWNKK